MEKAADNDSALEAKVPLVLEGLRQEAPLSGIEAAYCDEACVLRYLRARSGNVAKATKLLRASLQWRTEFGVRSLNIDEFTDNLSIGNMYIAGLDTHSRPVLMTRKKAEKILPGQHQKYLRFLTFTLESCVAAMPPGVEQWVWIMDLAGYSRANSPPLNISLNTHTILADHYPERLARCFIVDAPSVFYFLWKALSPFVDAATRNKIEFVYSKKLAAANESAPSGAESAGSSGSAPRESSEREQNSSRAPVGGFEHYVQFWKTPYDEAAYRSPLSKSPLSRE